MYSNIIFNRLKAFWRRTITPRLAAGQQAPLSISSHALQRYFGSASHPWTSLHWTTPFYRIAAGARLFFAESEP